MKVERSVLSRVNDGNVHELCVVCHAEGWIDSGPEDNVFRCKHCGKMSDRTLLIDPRVEWWIDDDSCYWHRSAGAFIVNGEGEFLIFLRRLYPLGWTLPAGHVDRGETPIDAVRREVFEEAGLSIAQFKQLTSEPLRGDSCRRGSDDHLWHLFLGRVDGRPDVTLDHEGIESRWVRPESAKELNLTLATRHFLDRATRVKSAS